MRGRDAFELIEDQLLDCSRNRVNFMYADSRPLEAYEVYEANGELNIVLQESTYEQTNDDS